MEPLPAKEALVLIRLCKVIADSSKLDGPTISARVELALAAITSLAPNTRITLSKMSSIDNGGGLFVTSLGGSRVCQPNVVESNVLFSPFIQLVIQAKDLESSPSLLLWNTT